ncbi:retropepsin-like aspartic protease family protein [Qipengyuania psychrotolerans]|uniref:TIGR02281 family clan AA aspartic protease n=1 Tax=Qipengyuania psychrotolerans TaxID=2867238 RepID=A0ABX8ZJJ4_9SPHN|nr:TIGR02281 family clan AA aspartic protease [Qipengyuania psychrotolerans]QZD87883.1 TIGR02281 family clan AA aspartic protease [Qipengyuania psychrotolerans]
MEPEAILSAAAELIRMVPRSGLLIGTIGALALGFIGSIMLRRKVAGGRMVRTVSTLALVGILVTVFLQIARFDPRLDSMTEIGLPDQTIVGEETVIPMAPDGHYWLRANVNGVPTRLMVDTGATLTAFSTPSADAAGLRPRPGGLPVMLNTANGTVTADLTTIEDLSFGNIRAEGLDAVIAPNLGRTNVLGMNFLSRLKGWRVEEGDLILTPVAGDLQ